MRLQQGVSAYRRLGDAMASVMTPAGTAEISQSQARAIKQNIANGYNASAATTRETWNWGMYDEAIHRQLSARVHAFDQFDSDGLCEQLYFYTASAGDHAPEGRAQPPRKVLEVGCGAGGGLNFLSRIEPQSEFVGVDLAQVAVDHASARFHRPGTISFVHGDAEQLPFRDGEFDLVINVESAHNYPSVDRFFAEVARVLKPGGHFSMVDVFTIARRREVTLAKQRASRTLRWLAEHDISEPVKRAVRQRLRPGSAFRQQVRRSSGFPVYLVTEPIMLRVYGAYFVDEGSRLNKLFRFHPKNGFRAIAAIESYRHLLARKLDLS